MEESASQAPVSMPPDWVAPPQFQRHADAAGRGEEAAPRPKGQRVEPKETDFLRKLFRERVKLEPGTNTLYVRLYACGIHDRQATLLASFMDDLLSKRKNINHGVGGEVALVLELDRNWIGDKGLAAVLAICEWHHVTFQHVFLHYNNITDVGVFKLAELLCRQPRVCTELHLSQNKLTARALVAVCMAVRGSHRAVRPGGQPCMPSWIRLEHNVITDPMMALKLLRDEGQVTICLAHDRCRCKPGACGEYPNGADDGSPVIHLAAMTNQMRRCEETPEVEMALRDEIHKWKARVARASNNTAGKYMPVAVPIPPAVAASTQPEEPEPEEKSGERAAAVKPEPKPTTVDGGESSSSHTDGQSWATMQRWVKLVVDLLNSDRDASIPAVAEALLRAPGWLKQHQLRQGQQARGAAVAKGRRSGAGQSCALLMAGPLMGVPEDGVAWYTPPGGPEEQDEQPSPPYARRSDIPVLLGRLPSDHAETAPCYAGGGDGGRGQVASPPLSSRKEFGGNGPSVSMSKEGGVFDASAQGVLAAALPPPPGLHLVSDVAVAGIPTTSLVASPEQKKAPPPAPPEGGLMPSDIAPSSEVAELQAQLRREKARADRAVLEAEVMQSACRVVKKGLSNLEPPRLRDAVLLVVKQGWGDVVWNQNYTLLHVAGELGRADIIPLLVTLRGDPNFKDDKGRTPIDIARAKKHTDCVELLRRLRSVGGADLGS